MTANDRKYAIDIDFQIRDMNKQERLYFALGYEFSELLETLNNNYIAFVITMHQENKARAVKAVESHKREFKIVDENSIWFDLKVAHRKVSKNNIVVRL